MFLLCFQNLNKSMRTSNSLHNFIVRILEFLSNITCNFRYFVACRFESFADTFVHRWHFVFEAWPFSFGLFINMFFLCFFILLINWFCYFFWNSFDHLINATKQFPNSKSYFLYTTNWSIFLLINFRSTFFLNLFFHGFSSFFPLNKLNIIFLKFVFKQINILVFFRKMKTGIAVL